MLRVEENAYGVRAVVPERAESGEVIPRSERIAKVIEISMRLGAQAAQAGKRGRVLESFAEGDQIGLFMPLGDDADDREFEEAADELLRAST